MHTNAVVWGLSLLLSALLSACEESSAACPDVSGVWQVTGGLSSAGACDADGTIVASQMGCDVVFSTSNGDAGVSSSDNVFQCTLTAAGACEQEITVGGSVRVDVGLDAQGGTVTFTEQLSNTECISQWRR